MEKTSRNIETALEILNDEIRGDVQAALKKMSRDYTMTWVYKTLKSRELFPITTNDLNKELEEVYPIKGRQYDIKNIAEGENLVMVELVESYPDPDTKKTFRTPLVLVLEFKDGKIRTGRHYCDPQIPFLHLSETEIRKIYK